MQQWQIPIGQANINVAVDIDVENNKNSILISRANTRHLAETYIDFSCLELAFWSYDIRLISSISIPRMY